ncbi:MAG: hypothetical protein NXI20_05660 [bacterium]|nr:hypothetical protein [bacterium]
MNLEDRLKYCKLCDNKSLNLETGLLCKLTNRKPAFDNYCPDYSENKYERKAFEDQLLYERTRPTGLFEFNSYPTEKFLITKAQKYLPQKFKIRRFDFRLLLIEPVVLIVTTILVGVFVTNPIIQISAIFIFVLLGVLITKKNYSAFIRDAEELAELSDVGINIGGNELLPWNDVTIVYIMRDLDHSYLLLEVLSSPDPIKLLIDKTLGSRAVLTITEAYRHKKKKT